MATTPKKKSHKIENPNENWDSVSSVAERSKHIGNIAGKEREISLEKIKFYWQRIILTSYGVVFLSIAFHVITPKDNGWGTVAYTLPYIDKDIDFSILSIAVAILVAIIPVLIVLLSIPNILYGVVSYIKSENKKNEDTDVSERIEHLNDEIEKRKDHRLEEAFLFVVAYVIILDVMIFSAMSNFSGPIAIVVLQMVVLIPLAKRLRVESIASLMSRAARQTLSRHDGDS